jgi:periplasmic divalent cation tolerance protein
MPSRRSPDRTRPAPEIVVVTTTVASEADADRIARQVVAERLAACAQVQGPIRSTFRWKGEVDQSSEWYCHLKTTRRRVAALAARIAELHSYDVPEILALQVVAGHTPYLDWVEQEVRSEE